LFERVADDFHLAINCTDSLRPTLERLTEELVDWRLAAYSKTHRLVELPIDNDIGVRAIKLHQERIASRLLSADQG
jgi:hypothetical protein